MDSVLHYSDYRRFLRDFYAAKKALNPSYSYRYFAKKADLQSANYFKLVMDGTRNLTHRNIRKFAKGLGLGDKEAHYFENLVLFNQAKDEEEKGFFKKNLDLIRANDDRGLLSKDQFEVLSNWYPLVIKELLLLGDFNPQPKKIAQKLDFKITPQQAKEAVELLVRLGLLRVLSDGKLESTNQNMQTPDATKSDAIASFHRQMITLARDSIDKQSGKDRCLSALTFAIRKKDLPEAFRRIHEFRNELDTYFSRGKPYDAVYQLNVQLFRLDQDD